MCNYSLAVAIKEACKAREESFLIGTGYAKSLEDAANDGCEEAGFDLQTTPIITMLITNSWNEALEWAETVLKEHGH